MNTYDESVVLMQETKDFLNKIYTSLTALRGKPYQEHQQSLGFYILSHQGQSSGDKVNRSEVVKRMSMA